jgi:hypothetical protein
VNSQLFKDFSSIIALKDRGFVSVSSIVNDWTVELKTEDGSVSSFSWILLYRASLSNYRVADFHQACDEMGKCVVVVKAENGRIAAAYNEDGFSSVAFSRNPNLNGFIVSVAEDGGCGEIFHRNDHAVGVWNHPSWSATFCGDVEVERKWIDMRCSACKDFEYVDYEVFKIVIE